MIFFSSTRILYLHIVTKTSIGLVLKHNILDLRYSQFNSFAHNVEKWPNLRQKILRQTGDGFIHTIKFTGGKQASEGNRSKGVHIYNISQNVLDTKKKVGKRLKFVSKILQNTNTKYSYMDKSMINTGFITNRFKRN